MHSVNRVEYHIDCSIQMEQFEKLAKLFQARVSGAERVAFVQDRPKLLETGLSMNCPKGLLLIRLRCGLTGEPMAALYGEIILEHYRNPRNYGSLPSPDISCEGVNPLCGDRIRIELQVIAGIVEAVRFKGDGCAISIAAASVLTELILGVDLTEGEPVSRDKLLSSLQSDIRPARVKCALLALEALRSGIELYTQGNSPSSRESQQQNSSTQ